MEFEIVGFDSVSHVYIIISEYSNDLSVTRTNKKALDDYSAPI